MRGHFNFELDRRIRYSLSMEELADEWEDEASEHALNGNPRRSHYVEQLAMACRMIARSVMAGGPVPWENL